MQYTKNEIIDLIKNRHVEPYYQPIRSVSDKEKYKKFEVLARIEPPGKEEISPYFFIKLSKEANVYDLVTEQIISKSFENIAYLKNENPEKEFKFSVNIQIDDVNRAETIQLIRNKLLEFNLSDTIIFELSEENALTNENSDATKKFVKIFKEMGCEFALDDFGTGYSSFHPLLEFDFDYIKFDEILIKELYKSPKNYYICDMLVEFSERVGLRTIAEYVEDEAHEKALETIGVEFYQGYKYSKPTKNIENLI